MRDWWTNTKRNARVMTTIALWGGLVMVGGFFWGLTENWGISVMALTGMATTLAALCALQEQFVRELEDIEMLTRLEIEGRRLVEETREAQRRERVG